PAPRRRGPGARRVVHVVPHRRPGVRRLPRRRPGRGCARGAAGAHRGRRAGRCARADRPRSGRRRRPGRNARGRCRRRGRNPRGRRPPPRRPRRWSRVVKLLVLCPHYAPDTAPTGEVMTSIGTELVARGHRLHVVTSLPWYRRHGIEPGWEGRIVRHEDTDWGRITRVHPFPTDKRNIPARAAAFAGFTVLSSAMGMRGRPEARPDAVLAMSPPLTLGGAGWLAARRWRVPFVFNIQDVFPDVAVE